MFLSDVYKATCLMRSEKHEEALQVIDGILEVYPDRLEALSLKHGCQLAIEKSKERQETAQNDSSCSLNFNEQNTPKSPISIIEILQVNRTQKNPAPEPLAMTIKGCF